ncbi:hypothetical protein OHA70_25445 [Kribbella sp. NBC_00382]|uniref:hypothetical protein n=1 Tax=Kribbella sp. NBC_00382 TaxID=2975967 RepID=UPI002E23CD5F
MSRRRTGRHATPNCTACGVRENTIVIQRAQLAELRRDLAAVRAAARQVAEQAVQNLHGLFTLPLAEQAAERFEQTGFDLDAPQRIRDYALVFMAECAGLELHQRVNVAYAPSGNDGPIGVGGMVVDVRLDRDGEPVLLVRLDDRTATSTLVAAGYDLAEVETDGPLAGQLLIIVPFPTQSRAIADGGWIEATS